MKQMIFNYLHKLIFFSNYQQLMSMIFNVKVLKFTFLTKMFLIICLIKTSYFYEMLNE